MPRQDKNTLFRREALQRLDDIDELDRLVTVTHPRAWLTLGAVAALIIVALVWASVGSLATTVSGEGILIAGSHIMRASAPWTAGNSRPSGALGRVVAPGRARRGHVAPPPEPRRRANGAVVTPYGGKVVSLQAYPGQYLAAGRAAHHRGARGVPLTATLYLPVETGKNVRPGQEVQIMPANVERRPVRLHPRPRAVRRRSAVHARGHAGRPAERLPRAAIRRRRAGHPRRGEAGEGPGHAERLRLVVVQRARHQLSAGTLCTARIVLSRTAPITYAFPAARAVPGRIE